MPTAALLLLGGITGKPPNVEPFNLGSVAFISVEPFDIIGPPVAVTSVEPFWIIGAATFLSVEPFDLGEKIAVTSTEPFDILGTEDGQFPTTDLGDGLPVAAVTSPIYGWWELDTVVDEDPGTIVTD